MATPSFQTRICPPPRCPRCRRRLAQAGSDDWLTAEVTNKCSRAVSFRAAYTYFDDLDGGHPCPNKLPGADGFSACSTQWQTIG